MRDALGRRYLTAPARIFTECPVSGIVNEASANRPLRDRPTGGRHDGMGEPLTQMAFGSDSACRRTAPGVFPMVRANARVKAASDW